MTSELSVYLDTSIVERYFKRAVESRREKKEIILPKIFEHFIYNPEIKLITSVFTFAEIFEHLWKNYKISPSEIAEIAQEFLTRFDIEMIFEFQIKAEILRWVRKYRIEAKDAIHLSIAKERSICLLTADANLLKRGRMIYDFIKSDTDLLSDSFSS